MLLFSRPRLLSCLIFNKGGGRHQDLLAKDLFLESIKTWVAVKRKDVLIYTCLSARATTLLRGKAPVPLHYNTVFIGFHFSTAPETLKQVSFEVCMQRRGKSANKFQNLESVWKKKIKKK